MFSCVKIPYFNKEETSALSVRDLVYDDDTISLLLNFLTRNSIGLRSTISNGLNTNLRTFWRRLQVKNTRRITRGSFGKFSRPLPIGSIARIFVCNLINTTKFKKKKNSLISTRYSKTCATDSSTKHLLLSALCNAFKLLQSTI